MNLRLVTLGGLDVLLVGRGPQRELVRQPKRSAVLAYLAVRGAWTSRNALLGLFWPDATEVRARAALRTTLHFLRGQLPAGALETRGDEDVRLAPGVVWCDAVAFRDAARSGRHEEALTLYRGALLDGFSPPGLPDFDDWLVRERESLRRLAAESARALYAGATSAGADERAISAARRWVEIAPYEEPAIRSYAAALMDVGDPTGALRAIEQWKARVAADLGARHGAETLSLERHLRAAVAVEQPDAGGAAAVGARGGVDADSLVTVGPRGAETVHSRAPRIRPLRALIAALALAIVATGGFVASRTALSDRASTAPLSVAVFPFTYGGAPEYEYLRYGVVDLLSARLSALTDVPVTDPRAVLGQYERVAGTAVGLSPAAGRELGARLGASYYVLGSIVELNGRLSLSATLYDAAAGREVAQVALMGSVEELFDVVDDAAYALVRTHVPGTTTPTEAATYRTSSPEALRHFIAGEVAFTRGRYDEAVASYALATSLDSTFARAWLRMSMAGTWQNSWATTSAALEHALLHAGNLSDDERLLLQAWRAHVLDGRPLRADSLYRSYLARHPEDAEAWLQLGEVRFHWGPTIGVSPRDAFASFDHALHLLPTHAGGLIHQIRLATRFGAATLVDSLVRVLAARDPDARDLAEARTLAALVARDSVRAANALPAVESLDDPSRLAIAHTVSGVAADPVLADRMIDRIIRPGEQDAEFDARHIDLLLASGRLRDADDALRRIKPDLAAERAALRMALPFLPYDPQAGARAHRALEQVPDAPLGSTNYYDVPEFLSGVAPVRKQLLLALLEVRSGDTLAARTRADRLERIGQGVDRAYGERFARLIRAQIAARRRDHAQVLALLGDPAVEPFATYPRLSSYFLAFERWLRAEALAGSGRNSDAIRWLETFPDNSGYDVAWTPGALARLTELYAAAGRVRDARGSFDRLRLMLREADPPLRAALERARTGCGAPCGGSGR